MRRPGVDRSTRLLGAVLAASVVVGIAATFLAAPATPLGPNPGRGPVSTSYQIVEGIGLGLLCLILGGMILFRVTAPRIPGHSSQYATPVAMFLVAIAFLAILHFVVPGGPLGTETNQTQSGPPPPPNETLPPASNHTVGPLPLAPGIPGWVGYVGLALVVVIVVLLVAPALRPARPLARPPVEPVRRSLELALHELATREVTDARSIIIGLYARLLDTVGPYFEELAAATPREIEGICVRQLGIAPAHASALTRLFEEARYSSHPFTDLQVEQARSALTAALADLRLRPLPPRF